MAGRAITKLNQNYSEYKDNMTDKKAKSAAERKKEERQRKRDSGLVPKEIWCRPEDWQKIKDYIAKITLYCD